MTNEKKTESPLITTKQLAALLGCSARHVDRMREAGRIPNPIRLGFLVRYHKDVIEEWMREGCPIPRKSDE